MFYVGFQTSSSPTRGGAPRTKPIHIPETTAPCRQFTGHLFDLAPKLFASAGVLLIVGLSVRRHRAAAVFARRTKPPQGLTMVVLLITFLGGTIMLALGVLGLYIFRIFGGARATPP